MAKLAKTVFVRDVEHSCTVVLHAGEEPEPRLAALVTNPDAWEDGNAPAAPEASHDGDDDQDGKDDRSSDSDNTEDDKPTVKKPAARKTAARKPAAN
ncbi:hypothetical protein [Streptomyces sp. 8L]|uniref:hypothetical protein n=1 Tax=Streptomyces sp. 8L TaxID=2877242 RepID=UPI001CD32DA6|nr:hypothetical protein [Streptomyces sp. 8L]MCA1220259.1 hypothetical protein [Streptomyces sp. 8L]